MGDLIIYEGSNKLYFFDSVVSSIFVTASSDKQEGETSIVHIYDTWRYVGDEGNMRKQLPAFDGASK